MDRFSVRNLVVAFSEAQSLVELKSLLDLRLPEIGFSHYIYLLVDLGLNQKRRTDEIKHDALFITNLKS